MKKILLIKIFVIIFIFGSISNSKGAIRRLQDICAKICAKHEQQCIDIANYPSGQLLHTIQHGFEIPDTRPLISEIMHQHAALFYPCVSEHLKIIRTFEHDGNVQAATFSPNVGLGVP